MFIRTLQLPSIQHALRWLPPLVAAGALLLGSQGALATTRVVVQPAVALQNPQPAAPITLGDIAKIEGQEAPTLGTIVVLATPNPSGDGTVNITLSQVRAAMDAAGVHWGRVTLAGSPCVVRVAPARVEPAHEAKKPLTNTLPKNPPQPVDTGAGTMRSVIGLRLAELYGVEAADLRVAFDIGDDEFLETAYTGDRIDIQPAANAGSARVPIRVTTYSGDRVVLDRTVMSQALLQRRVVTSTGPIDRGQAIGAGRLVEAVQWLSPSVRPAPAEQAAGSVATRKVVAGQVLVMEDIAAPVIVKRGDTVWVHALSGSVTVKAKAKSLGQGRDGEVVAFKLDGSDRVFSARMAGAGRAVLVVGEELR